MRAGSLRKRIAVMQEAQTPDGAGGYALAWTTVAVLWGEITPVSGREIFAAGHLEGHVTHKVTLRWQAGVTLTTDLRLAYNGRFFNILAVLNEEERNRQWTVMAEEGGAL